MQPQNPLIVRTAEESASTIDYRMGIMRTWLDHNRIDLSGFKLVTIGVGNVAFDAQFCDLGHAALFRAAFSGAAEPFGLKLVADNTAPPARLIARRAQSPRRPIAA
jgi:hypothetical protein